jgi:subtilase family serine protease
MLIARWQVEARFGYKQSAIDSMKKWLAEVGSQVGWKPDKVRLITGSIGANESTIETEIKVKSLKDLDDAWTKLGKLKDHKKWGKEFEKYIVSGTARWTVYRVVND